MKLLSYLQRFSQAGNSRLLLFLTDWQHVVDTGLQATKLHWDRLHGDVVCEGELDSRALGSRWQAAEAVLEATDGLSNAEIRQLMLRTYPMVTTNPCGPLDLPRLGWDYQNDVQRFDRRHQTNPPTRYQRLMASDAVGLS